jgi:very-short-patch-repair endonuclease
MTEVFNKTAEKEKRRELRNNLTEAEKIVWNKIRSKQINGKRFRRQVSIGPYVVDFYCPELKLIVEIDGDSHETDDAKEYDDYRDS